MNLPKRKLNDERGWVAHILKNTDPIHEYLNDGIAEVYASLCYPGKIKGWHYHHGMNMVYTCIMGIAQVVTMQPRTNEDGDPIREYLTEFIGEGYDQSILIPHRTWNAFRAVGPNPCIIVNCTDMVHDPEEIARMPDSEMDYQWDMHI